jgi:hypothetical protein
MPCPGPVLLILCYLRSHPFHDHRPTNVQRVEQRFLFLRHASSPVSHSHPRRGFRRHLLSPITRTLRVLHFFEISRGLRTRHFQHSSARSRPWSKRTAVYRRPRNTPQTESRLCLWHRACDLIWFCCPCCRILALGGNRQSCFCVGQRFAESRYLEKSRKRWVHLRQCVERRTTRDFSGAVKVLHTFSEGYCVSLPVVRFPGNGRSALASVRLYVIWASRS